MPIDNLALAMGFLTAAAADDGEGVGVDLSPGEVSQLIDGLLRLNLLLVHRVAFLEEQDSGAVLRKLALHIAAAR